MLLILLFQFPSSRRSSLLTSGAHTSPPGCPRCGATRTLCWPPCSAAGTTSHAMRTAATSSIAMEHISGERRCVTCRMTQREFAFDSVRAAGALLHPLMVKRVHSQARAHVCVCVVADTLCADYTVALDAESAGAVEEWKGQVENDETSQWKVTEKITSPLLHPCCVCGLRLRPGSPQRLKEPG